MDNSAYIGGILGGKHGEQIIERISAVDDERQVKLLCELDVEGKRRPLNISRRVIVMVVQAGLADGDYHRAGCHPL
jgi:hypothetical protein